MRYARKTVRCGSTSFTSGSCPPNRRPRPASLENPAPRPRESPPLLDPGESSSRRWLPYVYGALRLDWGFNELSAAFVIGAIVGRPRRRSGRDAAPSTLYLDGMQTHAAGGSHGGPRAQHFPRARGRPRRGHDPLRPRHAARARVPSSCRRAADDSVAGADSRRRAERQRDRRC